MRTPGPRYVKVENSSNVVGFEYDAITQVLIVDFRSGSYRYAGVTPPEYADLAVAPSKGSFIATAIKPHHQATRMADEAAS